MNKMSNVKLYLFSVLAALLLVVSGFSFWLSNTIFNEQVLVDKTVAVMTSQSTVQSLSSAIVDKTLENAPVVKNLIGSKLEGVVGGLLSTDTFANLVKGVSGKVYLQITSKNPKGVVISTTTIKSLVTPIANVVATPEQKTKLENLNIPDEIVIIDPNSVPSIYYLSNYLWIWPFALLGALGLLFYTIYISAKNDRLVNTGKAAGVVAVVAFLAAAVIPSIEPPIVNNIQNYNLRVVAGNIYTSLSAQLFNIYSYLAVIALLVVIGVVGYKLFMQYSETRAKAKK